MEADNQVFVDVALQDLALCIWMCEYDVCIPPAEYVKLIQPKHTEQCPPLDWCPCHDMRKILAENRYDINSPGDRENRLVEAAYDKFAHYTSAQWSKMLKIVATEKEELRAAAQEINP